LRRRTDLDTADGPFEYAQLLAQAAGFRQWGIERRGAYKVQTSSMKFFPLLSALTLGLALSACSDSSADSKKAKPPALVSAVAATSADYTPRLVALGTVTPLQSVAVKARVDGQITAILFREGDNVRAGQSLFKLDDRAAQALLAQARASLASARAAAMQAHGDLTRAEALVGKGFIATSVLDQRRANAEAADAAISSAAASVQSAQATLSYLTIRAPVSGRTGEIGFRLGANVRAADTIPLVTVNQLSPISVRFLVPPEQVQTIRDAMAGKGLTVTARSSNAVDKGPEAAASDAAQDAGPPIATGRLAFLDNNVDPGNGSVAAKAEFVNVGDKLWPGAIVNVELPLAGSTSRIVLPEAAVQTGRDAPFVWLIGADGKIAMRDVTVLGRANGLAYLAGGISAGDRIVVDALAKLKAGDTVRMKDGRGNARRTAEATSAVGG
jgi:RND family efflux transporter MFP subunit